MSCWLEGSGWLKFDSGNLDQVPFASVAFEVGNRLVARVVAAKDAEPATVCAKVPFGSWVHADNVREAKSASSFAQSTGAEFFFSP